jgi:hypothetical protein
LGQAHERVRMKQLELEGLEQRARAFLFVDDRREGVVNASATRREPGQKTQRKVAKTRRPKPRKGDWGIRRGCGDIISISPSRE